MKESKFGSCQESTGLLFWQVSALWQRAVKKALRPFHLTHTQYVILAVVAELSEHQENITQKQISSFSMIDPMTVSSTLRLLEKKGLTQRVQSEADSRANTIANTPLGQAVLKDALEAVENADIRFFFTEKKDTAEFQKLLLKLKQRNQQEQ